MVAYGISVIGNVDFDQVYEALGDLLLEDETNKDSNQVYVDLDNLREAVRRINTLGYETDEDEED